MLHKLRKLGKTASILRLCNSDQSMESTHRRYYKLKAKTPKNNNFWQAPCMVNGECSKKFPKEFDDIPVPNVKGYASYRRRSTEQAEVRGVQMDSRNVVPYNPCLALK